MSRAGRILHPDISPEDRAVSLSSLKRLQDYVVSGDLSLVFFVGDGASTAGSTGVPSTHGLLHRLLVDAIHHSTAFGSQHDELLLALEEISSRIGFEITLNDLWQICRQAVELWFQSFATFEAGCLPNRVHTFMAHCLSTGGTVVTTNYDRFIETEWHKTIHSIRTRYREVGPNSFARWRDDLDRGGSLFKVHGSLDDLESCLGALEHVRTQLVGHRGDLLTAIGRTRPLCILGWRGIDPDVPPLLFNALDKRDPSLPTFWVHYEGASPGSVSLESATHRISPLVRPYARDKPILTEADRAFAEILHWVGMRSDPNPGRELVSSDFSKAISRCSRSGATRIVGIALRRAGHLDSAVAVLGAASSLAQTNQERSAALQEISLAQQQKAGRDTGQARRILSRAQVALKDRPDPWLQLNADSGMLSMTITTLGSRPWLIVRIPGLFRRYRQAIETLRSQASDMESVALHESLFHLYLGRLRFKMVGRLAAIVPPLASWILKSFNIARSTIDDAKDIHLHSRIDVLAYRAVALARMRRCQDASEDIPEIDRLIAVLSDHARTQHWDNQRREIAQRCD